MKLYRVFNCDQIDGLPEQFQPVKAKRDDTPNERARQAVRDFLTSSARITSFHGARACYSPSKDEILISNAADFVSEQDYATTLAHELTHWTGHKSRCDREFGGSFGSKLYAFEELVAELGAAFLSEKYGYYGEHSDNHAAYLASWAQGLKDDPAALFKAAALAQKAVDFIEADIAKAANIQLAA